MWYLILWMVGKGMVTAYAGPLEFSQEFRTKKGCEYVAEQWREEEKLDAKCLYVRKEEKGSE